MGEDLVPMGMTFNFVYRYITDLRYMRIMPYQLYLLAGAGPCFFVKGADIHSNWSVKLKAAL